MTEFNVKRLNAARSLRGLTKKKLADLCQITTRVLTKYEKQGTAPKSFLRVSAEVLGFPIGFFFSDDLPDISEKTVSFRSAARMPAAVRDAALSAGQLAMILHDWMEREFVLPEVDVPSLSLEMGPEAAAVELRERWGLGELTITNVVHLLESKGVRVFSLAIDSPHVDAFSMWRDGTPFVFLNSFKSSERSRFDACHELAHLVLHRHSAVRGKAVEAEANAFASAFLMPEGSIRTAAYHAPTVEYLIHLKKKWVVSAAALATRIKNLNLITDWQYRSLCIEMSQRGFMRNEPEESPREVSLILSKVFASLRSEGRAMTIAKELDLEPVDLNNLTFGQSFALRSSGRCVSPSEAPKTGRPELRLVTN